MRVQAIARDVEATARRALRLLEEEEEEEAEEEDGKEDDDEEEAFVREGTVSVTLRRRRSTRHTWALMSASWSSAVLLATCSGLEVSMILT